MQIIGSYVQGTSLLHRMDARVKSAIFLLLMTAVFCADSLPGVLLLLGIFGTAIRLSRLPMRSFWNLFRQLRWFFFLLLLFNTFFSNTKDPWFSFWIFRPGTEGLLRGISVSYHMALFVLLSNLLTMTTTPSAITGAWTSLLAPFSVFGLPVRQIALILSAALEFIPILSEEAESIRRAQLARGAQFEASGFTARAKAIRPLLIPVFLAAFHRADELSEAIEARGWRPKVPGKRYYRSPCVPPRKQDFFALLLIFLLCTVSIFI